MLAWINSNSRLLFARHLWWKNRCRVVRTSAEEAWVLRLAGMVQKVETSVPQCLPPDLVEMVRDRWGRVYHFS